MTIKEAENQYQKYLKGHIGNVQEALELLKGLDISFINDNYRQLKEICEHHDELKYSDEEYEPYREHFYPINEDEKLKSEAFEQAVRHHIKNSKHHWDYWVNDNNELEIPDEQEYKLYCVERCCDWLAMANQHDEKSNDWYYANKDSIIMPDYGWELCDEIMSKVPEKCNLSFKGTRGELDESNFLNTLQPKIEDDESDKEGVEMYKKKILNGEHRPILVNDKNEVIDGNHTMVAYKELGIEPKEVYLGTSQEFLKTASEIIKAGGSKNPGLDAIYKMIENGTAVLLEDEQFKVIRGENGYLVEANMSYLKRKTISEDPTRAKRSKNVQSKYLGISKYGVLNFETTSETHSGVKWYQEVHFPSFDGFLNIVEQGDVIEPEDVKKAMSSDNLKISCDDPSFLYWAWKYMAWRDVYGLEKETRAPQRNNRRLKGALCKHLYSVIELLNERRILELITRDLNEFCKKKLGIENDGYQDAEGILNKDLKANQYDYNIEDVLKGILSKENFEKYQNGTKLADLGLTDEEMAEIDDAIKNMRDRGQFALRSELEKQFAPAKRGRRIKRADVKLSVGNKEEEL